MPHNGLTEEAAASEAQLGFCVALSGHCVVVLFVVVILMLYS
jgi:hypothetical protein